MIRLLRLSLAAFLAFPLPAEAARVVVPKVTLPNNALINGQGGVNQANIGQNGLPLLTPSFLPRLTPSVVPSLTTNPLPLNGKAELGAEQSQQPFAQLSDATKNGDSNESSSAKYGGLFDGSDPLSAERFDFDGEEMLRIRNLDTTLTDAVTLAAQISMPDARAKVVSRGSTSRLTHAERHPDYDISLKLPGNWTHEKFDDYMRRHGGSFESALTRVLEENLGRMGGELVSVYVSGPKDIMSPVSGQIEEGVTLYRVDAKIGDEIIKLDVPVTVRSDYANPYPQRFEAQLEEVRKRGGQEAVDSLLSDIRLAKRLFRDGLKAYKFYQGGPTAVGVEQMVLQAGSFDKMMQNLHKASFDERGGRKNKEAFQNSWLVKNEFMQPGNFLALIGDKVRDKIADATQAYFQARAAGKAIRFSGLKSKPAFAEERPATGTEEDHVIRLTVDMSHAAAGRMLKKLRKRVHVAATRRSPSQTMPGYLEISLTMNNGVHVKQQLNLIASFFKDAGRQGKLKHVSFAAEQPQAGSTAHDDEGEAEDGEPGQLTMEMLDNFSTLGEKPSTRGEAFAYAQGAQVLPEGLEASWAAKKNTPLQNATHRTLLLRRNGRVYIQLMKEDSKRPVPVTVDESLVQGIVSETLVDVITDGRVVSAVRPVGGYPQDVMIGRVVKRNGALLLEGLFQEKGRPVSLYAPMPISGAAEGSIVQAFVKPAASGYEAVSLLDLGREVTPELAAREIALRRGARAYFEKDVILQAEEAARKDDPVAAYEQVKKNGAKAEDLRSLSFITIDPPGAGDLDDAYYVEKHQDGSYTWFLATADVAHYVRPGTPAFKTAARVGNTFYSIDKNGVPEYPMNHPVVSKNLASLLSGKDSIAMITRMRFDKDGQFLVDQSEVFLGLVHVKGRYTYEQVADLWNGGKNHGVAHLDQVALARELSGKLVKQDNRRGKLDLSLDQVRSVKRDGKWVTENYDEDPLLDESHHLIEELKVYGNRVIAQRLNAITGKDSGVKHVSRVHPEVDEAIELRLKDNLKAIGAAWKTGTIAEYLTLLQKRTDLSHEVKQVAQFLVLTSRQSAKYAADDAEGHEGLALKAGQYDHPSAPIRRFSDMFNRALLEASLEGSDPKALYEAMLADLKALGFGSLDDYLSHLNGREQATRQMDYEVDAFMSLHELSKPENRKTFKGYVRMARPGRFPMATIQLEGVAATVVLTGPEAEGYALMDRVEVEVRGADLVKRKLDAKIRKTAKR